MAAPFGDLVRTEQELRELVPAPNERTLRKQIAVLDGHCRDFIARSPFLLLATAGADGRCDASPRGGPPGFARVLDERRLLVPEYPGNRRADSHRNILGTGRCALIFMVPGYGETLRVAGRAVLTRDPELLAPLAVGERPPLLGIGVEPDEVFLHCAKALKRSGLWRPEDWPDLEGLAGAARILSDHVAMEEWSEAAYAARLRHAYEAELY